MDQQLIRLNRKITKKITEKETEHPEEGEAERGESCG